MCQNPCSGHGYCDIRTKKCVCSTFWTQNPFTAHYGNQRSNCGMWVWFSYLCLLYNPIRLECLLCNNSCDGNSYCLVSCYLVMLLLLFAQVSNMCVRHIVFTI